MIKKTTNLIEHKEVLLLFKIELELILILTIVYMIEKVILILTWMSNQKIMRVRHHLTEKKMLKKLINQKMNLR